MIQIFTSDGTDDIVVERKSGVDVAAPWSTGQANSESQRLDREVEVVGLANPSSGPWARLTPQIASVIALKGTCDHYGREWCCHETGRPHEGSDAGLP
jgi:hypothetical protein